MSRDFSTEEPGFVSISQKEEEEYNMITLFKLQTEVLKCT